MSTKKQALKLFEKSGIELNGPNAWDIQVHDESVYNRVFANGRLAFGESFMDKQWDCDDLVGALSRLLSSGAADELKSLSTMLLVIKSKMMNLQSRGRAFQVAQEHYDYGNDMYEAMLGPTMTYTSGVGGVTAGLSLDESQDRKHDQLCQKMGLQPGDRVLDIGCGWGGFMKYAATHYGVSCVGLSVSVEQTEWGQKWCRGLPIEFVISDYRDYVDPQGFDHIVSVEMLEHVGPKNYRDYFAKVHEWLKPGGRFMLQVIGTPSKQGGADPWLDKYIFPNGILPSLHLLDQATRGTFIWDHMEDIGIDYDHTLMGWWNNLQAAYPALHRSDLDKYNERFLRMFKYYLHSCAALFRTRSIYDWQIVMTKR